MIAAACARPLVRAAAGAGYKVIAADVFCDEDTRRAAFQTLPLRYMQGGFAPQDVRERLLPLLAEAGTACVYGSGFEPYPELLDEIAAHCPVIGNDAATVRRVKQPTVFFAQLASLGVPYPATSLVPPASGADGLMKRVGGSGGTHIRTPDETVDAAHYYQERLPGTPASLLFLANGNDCLPVGYNAQWLAPAPGMPYRYGGAVSQAALPGSVCSGMLDAARRLSACFGLRGLNSLDVMVSGVDWWVLEINPRLSATFALYDVANQGVRLFRAHVQACAGELSAPLPAENAQAHLIYYANQDRIIPSSFDWPAWTADIPAAGTRIASGGPLCSILAEGATAERASASVRERAEGLTTLLCNLPENIR